MLGYKPPSLWWRRHKRLIIWTRASVELGDAKAKIVSCIEKFSFRKKSIKVDLRCYIVMDDNAPGIMEYVAILIGNEELTKNFDEGKSIFPPSELTDSRIGMDILNLRHLVKSTHG